MQNKSRLAFLLVGVILMTALFGPRPSFDQSIRFKVKGNIAYVNGSTFTSSYSVVKTFLNENPQVNTFVLQRMPGTKDSFNNLRIARLIRDRGINTRLERRSRIASGAVDLFIAGNQRSMECGAMIGVHSWSIGDAVRFSPKDMKRDELQPIHEKFLYDMGVDPDFYVFTREAAEPEELYFLLMDEIEHFGLLTEPANCE